MEISLTSYEFRFICYILFFRVNQPSTPPTMISSSSSIDLAKVLSSGSNLGVSNDNNDATGAKINGVNPAYSPSKTSREGSVDGEDLVYASVQAMSQGKCGVGVEIYEVCFFICRTGKP